MSHNVPNVPVGLKLHADVKPFLGFQGCFRTNWILILHHSFNLLFLEVRMKDPVGNFITQSKYMTLYFCSHNCTLARKERGNEEKRVRRFKQF